MGVTEGLQEELNRAEEEVGHLESAVLDLRAQIQFILTTHRLWDDDGKYQFPDGEVVEKE